MFVNAGFFPADDDSLDQFARLYLEALPHADVMAVWFNPGEQRIVSEYCEQAPASSSCARCTACCTRNPGPRSSRASECWSSTRSRRRSSLSTRITGGSCSRIRRCCPSSSSRRCSHRRPSPATMTATRSWFDALAQTCERIGRESYDVALIGAGAYGLPIADIRQEPGSAGGAPGRSHAAALRHQRAPVGSRVSRATSSRCSTRYWVRPSAEETPEGASLVEGGCYW